MVFWSEIIQYFGGMLPTFVLYTINVHWETIYCKKFTVEETGNSNSAMFRQHDSWTISNIIFEAHPES